MIEIEQVSLLLEPNTEVIIIQEGHIEGQIAIEIELTGDKKVQKSIEIPY